MTTVISTADARKKFADIINQVAYGTEKFVLTRRGKEIAALVSMEELCQGWRRTKTLMFEKWSLLTGHLIFGTL